MQISADVAEVRNKARVIIRVIEPVTKESRSISA